MDFRKMLCLLFNTICVAPEHHWPVLLCGVNIAEKIEILNLQHIGKVMVNQTCFMSVLSSVTFCCNAHIHFFKQEKVVVILEYPLSEHT